MIAFNIKEIPQGNYAPRLFTCFNNFEGDGLYIIGFSSSPGSFDTPGPEGYIYYYDAYSLEFIRSKGYSDKFLTPDTFKQFGILPDKDISMDFDKSEFSLVAYTTNPFYILVNRILTYPDEFTSRLKDEPTI